MEPTRPDIIQAAQAHQALRYFGQVLRTEGWQTHVFRRVSFPTDKIDEFWSHSWHGNKWSKILTAFFLYNFKAAATASTLGAMLMMILFSMGLLPDLRLENPTYPSSSWWCTAVGFYLYLLVSIFWRPWKHIFLDVLCIDQQNEDEKVAAIVSMGAFLKCSDALLVLWDPSYTHRLSLGVKVLGADFLSPKFRIYSRG
ncbi:unnamed protein product [Symbiodinium natans]|uniref:Uncharacterized protein n=1 Tax=Symbiodinium natans TaxID=878477 RepID=A0A812MZG9_9DINO|nr:unnamed protein product [Symbiodinium natans]